MSKNTMCGRTRSCSQVWATDSDLEFGSGQGSGFLPKVSMSEHDSSLAQDEFASPPPSPDPVFRVPSNTPFVPSTTRLPTIPIFAGLDNDLPDVSELSLWADLEVDDESQAGLCDESFDISIPSIFGDMSFTSDTPDSADVSSEMSFSGLYTPSPSRFGFRADSRRGLDNSHRCGAFESGLGLGILGLDTRKWDHGGCGGLDLENEPPSPSERLTRDLACPNGESLGPCVADHDSELAYITGATSFDIGSGSPRRNTFLLQDHDSPSPLSFTFPEDLSSPGGAFLPSIPECESRQEIGVPTLRSERTVSEDCRSYFSTRVGDSEDLDLSFSFPSLGANHQKSSGAWGSGSSGSPAAVMRPNLKRTSSLPKSGSTTRGGGFLVPSVNDAFPATPSMGSSIGDAALAPLYFSSRLRSASYPRPPSTCDSSEGYRDALRLERSPSASKRASHKRWRL
ncbi:hypothetical protein D9611_012143 [Ephemerocybe angulata]|uniref:Uncharacterized protein n=1 Tax=Ephemerocybe angulata TaxID=980116 RepID=A0A8H5C6C5_9AGAR|nr:hypothetical protein D9611_012143 [Tulosesus angulatus]